MKLLQLTVSFAFLIASGCSPKVSAVSDIDFLQSLRERNPENDARQAIKSQRIRFLGVAGYSSHVPGIDTENCLVDREMVEIIPGTGDVWTTAKHGELQQVAKEYAARFNSVIKSELETRKISIKFGCVPGKGNATGLNP